MSTCTSVAAAAPRWVRDLVDGPKRDVPIVHSGLHAIYVAVTDGAAPRCVGVLSARSSFAPCGMRTTLADLSELLVRGGAPAPGDVASIGGGTLEVGSTHVRIGRTVDTSMPSLDPAATSDMSQMLKVSLGGREQSVRSELSSASLSLLQDGDPTAVMMLLGRGSGLTPVGDDVLAGWLAITGAARPGFCPVALEVARKSDHATTLLSATLLDRAASGDVVPEFRQLAVHMRLQVETGTPGELDSVIDRILEIGHTSGAGMLLGCLIALDHLKQAPPTARDSRI